MNFSTALTVFFTIYCFAESVSVNRKQTPSAGLLRCI